MKQKINISAAGYMLVLYFFKFTFLEYVVEVEYFKPFM